MLLRNYPVLNEVQASKFKSIKNQYVFLITGFVETNK